MFVNPTNHMLYYIRDDEGALEGFKYDDIVYYYEKNLADDIIGILNQNKEKIATYEYDSWGNILSIKDENKNEITDSNHIAIINPFRYRSYYYDKETNLYYLNSRYYNPRIKRFLNMDSYGGEVGGNILLHNPYIYSLNNPIVNYDEDGYFAISISGAAIVGLMLIGAAFAWGWAMGSGTLRLPSIPDKSDLIPKATTKPKSKGKTKTKTKTKTKSTPVVVNKKPSKPKNKNNKKPCTTARRNGAKGIKRGERLTFTESVARVSLNLDIMCDNEASAELVAKQFDDYYCEKKHKPFPGYYNHCHNNHQRNHAHIWFFD